MVLGWRRRGKNKKNRHEGGKVEEVVTPIHFRCPISLELMKDPVTLCTGITYDRESIERWFDEGSFTCPVTNQIVTSFDLIPNHTLRMMIQDWCVENQQHGVERIPTPRVPITPVELQELLLVLHAEASRLDQHACLELVQRIQRWGAESERNMRCMAENGAPPALASAFDAFANDSVERNATVLHGILSALNSMFPHRKHLGSRASLRCMVWFLRRQDLSGKENSIVALEQLLSFGDHQHVEALAEIEGINQLLLEFLDQTIFSPTITKASLALVWYLVSSSSPCSEKMRLKFIELGMVSLVLDILVDSERSLCEKALAVFDSLCGCQQGREKVYSNALAIPLLVKKLLRVSSLGSDYSVSAIWKLCKFGEEMVLIEALQLGAFQKLLLVLQIGCGDQTKEKATELLKLFNPYRTGVVECIDSDFKNLKRSI
ncbi:U-box domain-containing protein 21 [Spatholobus suberectus]|nr:U-box domain-containing protein 21 [Spatholobus suberectus]